MRDIDLTARADGASSAIPLQPRAARAAIFEIADDGRAQRGEMHADLVRAAGQGLGCHPGIFIACVVHHGVVRQCIFGVVVTRIARDHFLVAAMRALTAFLHERCLDCAAALLRHAFHQRPIDFSRIALRQRFC